MSIPNFTPELGRELFYGVWRLVGENFFYTKRLRNWSKLKHQFDDEIVDEESALSAIDKLLARLKDAYTERIIDEAATETSAVSARAGTAVAATKFDPLKVTAFVREDGIAYLRIPHFDDDETLEQVKAGAESLAACDGLVIDLRHNAGGRMHDAMSLCGLFLSEGRIATVKSRERRGFSTRIYAINESHFYANVEEPNGSKCSEVFPRAKPIFAGKPIVVLIDKCTASSAELMALALAKNSLDVRIVGNGPTPGKGIGQAQFSFVEGRLRIRVTRLHWYDPSDDWLGDSGQTKSDGIIPDVLVEGEHILAGIETAYRTLRRMIDAKKN